MSAEYQANSGMGIQLSEARAVKAAAGAAEDSTVAAFFAGKDVLVTGASGFLGRVLVERLLRDAPDIGTLFLLLRPKRGLSPQERLVKFTNVSLFERLLAEQPGALAKLRGVAGDMGMPGLGLSADDRALLEERVAVIFHSAAAVRFDSPLHKAVLLNVRGTRDLCDLALGMPRLQAFVHVSTAFSNCDRLAIGEELYPPPGDWRTYIHIAETFNPQILDIITAKLVGNHVNTYIFTKAMAEHVVNEYRHQLPIGIVRPSIVSASEVEPFPGWLDNFNGATSLQLAGTLGATHIYYADITKYFDAIPVDYVIGGIVLEAVYLGMNRNLDSPRVCNATTHNRYFFDLVKITKAAYNLGSEATIQRVYKRYFLFIQSVYLYRMLFILLELPISLVLDGIALLTNQKMRMLSVHRRTLVGSLKLSYFTHNTFEFTNKNFLSLTDTLRPNERKSYKLSTEHILKEPYCYATSKELKDYFFPHQEINPGWQDTVLEIIHFIVCGILLFLLWKSTVITKLISLLLNILIFLLAI